MSSVGAELLVTGMVQGVGYRYFAYRHAINLGITGWVRNEPDGTVRLFVEGDRSVVEALIAELKAGPRSSSVSDVAVSWREFTGKHSDFRIEMR